MALTPADLCEIEEIKQLKASYFRQAVQNIADATNHSKGEPGLFDAAEIPA